MKRITMLLFVLVLLSCTRDKNPAGPSDSDFGFYFLQDESVTIFDVNDGATNLQPASEPWLTARDITFYDFSSHCLYLKKPKKELFPEYASTFELMEAMPAKPFWVMVNGKQCYLAAFDAGYHAMAPFLPYFDPIALDAFPNDVLPLRAPWHSDTRDNQMVKQALKAAGLYHAGLAAELQDVKVTDNSDIATVQYTLKITNNDVDDLLVLDADKMGSGLFHYFTNGPVISSEESQLMYQSLHKEFQHPPEGVEFDPSWFTTIKSGQSKTWTITLKGYDAIQPGSYECDMHFSSPMRITLDERFVGKARYWLGDIQTPTITVEL